MIRIKVCECCGEPIEVDDADEWDGTCGECEPYDEDMIGMIDFNEWTED